MSKQTHHLLSLDERIKFYNDMVNREMVLHNERVRDTFHHELVTFRYYTPPYGDRTTDDQAHRYLDIKNVPWRVENNLWKQYKEALD